MAKVGEEKKSILIDEGTFDDYVKDILINRFEELHKNIPKGVLVLGIGMELAIALKDLKCKLFEEEIHG